MSDTSNDPLYETMSLVRIAEMNPEGRARYSGGVVQGGFVTGWIDAAMAHAAIAKNGAGVTPMTLELKVSFFAPVRPGLVIAEGWAVRNGRKTAFYEGHLLDEAGNVLAKASTTMMLADRSRVEAASKAAVEG